MSTRPQHPEARCGICDPCKYIESTKRIVLAHSAPAGPGIGQAESEMWNKALEENPCYFPLVLVPDPRTLQPIQGRIVSVGNDAITVNTAECGEIRVPAGQVSPWSPPVDGWSPPAGDRGWAAATLHAPLLEAMKDLLAAAAPAVIDDSDPEMKQWVATAWKIIRTIEAGK